MLFLRAYLLQIHLSCTEVSKYFSFNLTLCSQLLYVPLKALQQSPWPPSCQGFAWIHSPCFCCEPHMSTAGSKSGSSGLACLVLHFPVQIRTEVDLLAVVSAAHLGWTLLLLTGAPWETQLGRNLRENVALVILGNAPSYSCEWHAVLYFSCGVFWSGKFFEMEVSCPFSLPQVLMEMQSLCLLIPYGLSPSCLKRHRGTAVSKFLEISLK